MCKYKYRKLITSQLYNILKFLIVFFLYFRWSFGIVLWEICTMGGSPYPGLPTEDLFDYLTTGKRMSQPVTCPDELYEIMVQCWQERLEERPWFHEIVSQLQRIVESKVMVCGI